LLDGWPAESASAFYRLAMCQKELGKYRAAEMQAAVGLSRVPKSAELLRMAGFTHEFIQALFNRLQLNA